MRTLGVVSAWGATLRRGGVWLLIAALAASLLPGDKDDAADELMALMKKMRGAG